MVGVAVFGGLLERRHGPFVVLFVFALCGIGGVAASEALVPDESYFGTYGAALGLLAAWAVPILLGRRKRSSTTRPTSWARPFWASSSCSSRSRSTRACWSPGSAW